MEAKKCGKTKGHAWNPEQIFFAITENALEDFYILVGIIHSKKGENDAENGDYCQSIPLSG